MLRATDYELQMQKIYKRILFAVSALITALAMPPSAHAYDVDTHFYATYAMARYAGIRHEVAARIAIGAQWMDESYVSDPTSMILMPLTGVKKRRLLHFPSSRALGSMQASTQIRILGFDQMTFIETWVGAMLTKYAEYEGRLSELALSTETVEDHDFGSELFMEGLKAGNLMMASAGLHVLEDSFAHAGTAAEEGHVRTWH